MHFVVIVEQKNTQIGILIIALNIVLTYLL